MYDSELRDPSLLGGGSADRWRSDLRILILEAELAETRHELQVLRETSAQMLAAILVEINKPPAATIAAPPEICELADLDESAALDADDPITAEIPELVVDRDVSLERLDRRFRWVRTRVDQK